ncbi:MAG: hypothetical protein IPQ07_23490 [Myxococcales bacterium]|nr:hypothetical protein [Myxococcales bacterium]
MHTRHVVVAIWCRGLLGEALRCRLEHRGGQRPHQLVIRTGRALRIRRDSAGLLEQHHRLLGQVLQHDPVPDLVRVHRVTRQIALGLAPHQLLNTGRGLALRRIEPRALGAPRRHACQLSNARPRQVARAELRRDLRQLEQLVRHAHALGGHVVRAMQHCLDVRIDRGEPHPPVELGLFGLEQQIHLARLEANELLADGRDLLVQRDPVPFAARSRVGV